MKILLVHNHFKMTGGADVFFREIGRLLELNGHEVAYFSTKDKDNEKTIWEDYFCTKPKYGSRNFFVKAFSIIKVIHNKNARNKFQLLVDQFKPDLVHCFNIMSNISPSILYVIKKNNIPVTISINDYKHICPNYKLFHHGKICEDCIDGKFYKCFINSCCHNSRINSFASMIESYAHKWLDVYKKFDHFLFASDFMINKTKNFWNYKFSYGKVLNPFNIPSNTHSISGSYALFFGRLIDEKGIDVLVKALINLQNIQFKIIGDGPLRSYLEDSLTKLGNSNIEYLGPKWGDDLNMQLANCKFVVVPSTWHENFPYVILQSFLFSKAVIASRRGGIPELITPDRGVLVEPNNHSELSKEIEKLFFDEQKCISMGQNGRKFLEKNFNDKIIYDSIIENYNITIKRKLNLL